MNPSTPIRTMLTAGLVLTPFITIGLPFERSLVVQALLIVCLVAAHAFAGIRQWPRLALTSIAEPGLILYTAATALGAMTGLARGAPIRDLAGQTLAMGLLPAATLAATALPTPGERHWLWRGLFAGTTVGAAIQLIWGLWTVVVRGSPTRLYLPNSVSVIGPSLMAVVGAAVFWNHEDRELRRWARCAGLTVGLVVLLAGVRSLWVVAPAAALLGAVLHRRPGRRTVLRGGVLVAIAIVLCVAGIAGVEHHVHRLHLGAASIDMGAAFPGVATSSGQLVISDVLPRSEGTVVPAQSPSHAWLVTAVGTGQGRGCAVVRVTLAGSNGRIQERTAVTIRPGHEATTASAVVVTGEPSAPLMLAGRLRDGASGRWTVNEIRIRSISSVLHASLIRQYLHFRSRIDGLAALLRTGDPLQDPTLGFRWNESLRTIEAWRGSGLAGKLLGAGLGASISIEAGGFDNRGNWVHYDTVNYLHNWYLFLLYKLGIVGGIAVLAAVAVWTTRRLVDAWSGTASAAAGAAVLIGTAAWSVTSPEFIDFRVAPLLGWMLAISVRPDDGANAG